MYMKEHERLNHISHKSMIELAKKGKISKDILKINKPPVCPSCLFGMVHKRPWRTGWDHGKIRKDDIKPGEVASIDQIIMSQPGIVPQAVGKLTKKRFTGSQICIDHYSRVKHIAHLKDFTTESTLAAKEEYETFIADRGGQVKQY